MSVLLSARGVSRSFGGLTAVDEISFDLLEGQVVSIVGPNGAGKTTLFNLLSGQLRPTGGEVCFEGEVISKLAPHRRAALGIGRTFQIVRPLRSQTVLENTMIGAFIRYPRRAAAESRACEVLERLDLLPRASEPASSLTLAEHKRLEIARALAGEPKALLLDEVMAGLNATETAQAIEIVRSLAGEGITCLIIEHDLKVVRALAQQVIVLDHGSEIARGSAEAVLRDPAVIEAYLGTKESDEADTES